MIVSVHSVLTGKGRGGARPMSIFSTNNDFSHQIRVPRCPVPLVPILKKFLGPLGPIFGSKMGQNGLKCHLWGPDGPKCLEQGGTRLEQGTGYKDWPFWSLYHSINTQIWPLGGLKMGQNGSIWLLLGLNGLWCPKMVGTSWNKVGTG